MRERERETQRERTIGEGQKEGERTIGEKGQNNRAERGRERIPIRLSVQSPTRD